MKNLIVYWFELVKMLAYIFIGIIPMMAFVAYSPGYKDCEYDALYSITIWVILGLIEVGQVGVSIYQSIQHNKEENKNEQQTQG